ncbi:Mov34/MPN/PAD-1 family protein [Vibrio sp. 10N.247.311.12]|uniref:Mov34/MPN/PAD-1 family protein n=1 Tax=Vibrio sp. 10N.247.311.12 TaxID=3229991 RepID=UPI00354F368B
MWDVEKVLLAEDGTRVLIEAGVFSKLAHYRQYASDSVESGGIIIGEYRGSDLRIVDVSTPGNKDIQRKCFFGRRDHSHQDFALDYWKRSSGSQSYIGDWHTHPQHTPQPSGLDIIEWQRVLTGSPMLVVILGIQSDWLALWRANKLVYISL